MPAIAAATRIAVLDTGIDHLADVEPFLVLIEKFIHPVWVKLSAREVANILYVFAKYDRQPRPLLLARAPYHLDDLLTRQAA